MQLCTSAWPAPPVRKTLKHFTCTVLCSDLVQNISCSHVIARPHPQHACSRERIREPYKRRYCIKTYQDHPEQEPASPYCKHSFRRFHTQSGRHNVNTGKCRSFGIAVAKQRNSTSRNPRQQYCLAMQPPPGYSFNSSFMLLEVCAMRSSSFVLSVRSQFACRLINPISRSL